MDVDAAGPAAAEVGPGSEAGLEGAVAAPEGCAAADAAPATAGPAGSPTQQELQASQLPTAAATGDLPAAAPAEGGEGGADLQGQELGTPRHAGRPSWGQENAGAGGLLDASYKTPSPAKRKPAGRPPPATPISAGACLRQLAGACSSACAALRLLLCSGVAGLREQPWTPGVVGACPPVCPPACPWILLCYALPAYPTMRVGMWMGHVCCSNELHCLDSGDGGWAARGALRGPPRSDAHGQG